MADDKVSVFISYAHEDEPERLRLRKYLDQVPFLEVWDDRDISLGAEWDGEINASLDSADIMLMLLSEDFLNSDYVKTVEIPAALGRHETAKQSGRTDMRVIPILLKECPWEYSGLAQLQFFPEDERWVIGGWDGNTAKALNTVRKGIEQVAKEILDDREVKAEQLDTYRRKVLWALSDDHEISSEEDLILEDERKRLGLAEDEALAIRKSAIQTFDERREYLDAYSTALASAVERKQGELDDSARTELTKLQAHFGLTSEDIEGLEAAEVARWNDPEAVAARELVAQQEQDAIAQAAREAAEAKVAEEQAAREAEEAKVAEEQAAREAEEAKVAEEQAAREAAEAKVAEEQAAREAAEAKVAEEQPAREAEGANAVEEAEGTFAQEAGEPDQDSAAAEDWTETLTSVLTSHQAKIGNKLSLAPDIPNKKLRNARSRYGVPADEGAVGVLDTTILGSAKEGMLFGEIGIYFNSGNGGASTVVPYGDLPACSFEVDGSYIDIAGAPFWPYGAGLDATFALLVELRALSAADKFDDGLDELTSKEINERISAINEKLAPSDRLKKNGNKAERIHRIRLALSHVD